MKSLNHLSLLRRLSVPLLLSSLSGLAYAAQNDLVSLSTAIPPTTASTNAYLAYPDVSADGRYVVFASQSTNLVAGDTNNKTDIFWRDRQSETTVRVSVSTDGRQANGDSDRPAISADGCRVIFESRASNLVPGDTNGQTDIFVHNLCTNPGTTERVNVGPGGVQANSYSGSPDISGNGHYAVFWTCASNLLASSNTGCPVIRRDLTTGENRLVNGDPASLQTVGSFSGNPVISDDGSYVAFQSRDQLTSTVIDGGIWQIYRWHATDNAIELVSVRPDGTTFRDQGNESASRSVLPAISGNGQVVAFSTTSDNLVDNDVDTLQDVYVKNMQTGTVVRASTTSGGVAGNGDSPVTQGERVSLSYDGRYVAFSTSATNLVDADIPGSLVLKDLQSGQATAINRAVSGVGATPALSQDLAGPDFVAFYSPDKLDNQYATGGIFLQDRSAVVPAPNLPPVANAGAAQRVEVGQLVGLDASGSSDPENDTLTFQWSLLPGSPSAVVLSNPAAAQPTFTPTVVGTYRFAVAVSDGQNRSTSEVSAQAVPVGAVTSLAPVAKTPLFQLVRQGDFTVLDGRGSFAVEDGMTLSYEWKQIDVPGLPTVQPGISLTSSNTPLASFTAPGLEGASVQVPYLYGFQLKVCDATNPFFLCSTAETIVLVNPPQSDNKPPLAVAKIGQNQYFLGRNVVLNGSGSSDVETGKRRLKYAWFQVDGPADVVMKGVTSARASFVPPKPGDYVFGLLVFDGKEFSEPSWVTVAVAPELVVKPPAAATVGAVAPTKIEWKFSGIHSRQGLSVYYSPDQGDTWMLLRRNVPAKNGFINWRPKAVHASQPNEGLIAVCVPKTKKNDPFCRVSDGYFNVATP